MHRFLLRSPGGRHGENCRAGDAARLRHCAARERLDPVGRARPREDEDRREPRSVEPDPVLGSTQRGRRQLSVIAQSRATEDDDRLGRSAQGVAWRHPAADKTHGRGEREDQEQDHDESAGGSEGSSHGSLLTRAPPRFGRVPLREPVAVGVR